MANLNSILWVKENNLNTHAHHLLSVNAFLCINASVNQQLPLNFAKTLTTSCISYNRNIPTKPTTQHIGTDMTFITHDSGDLNLLIVLALGAVPTTSFLNCARDEADSTNRKLLVLFKTTSKLATTLSSAIALRLASQP